MHVHPQCFMLSHSDLYRQYCVLEYPIPESYFVPERHASSILTVWLSTASDLNQVTSLHGVLRLTQ